jgi:hypothetical protein
MVANASEYGIRQTQPNHTGLELNGSHHNLCYDVHLLGENIIPYTHTEKLEWIFTRKLIQMQITRMQDKIII